MTTPYPQITAELRAIGPVIEVPRTTQLYAPLHPAVPPPEIAIARDLRYGPHERHVLDVFTLRDAPRGAASKPIVAFIHGGGFRMGGKQLPNLPFHDNVGIWAAHAGLIGVTLNYRLAPEFTWPAGAEDMARAVQYLREQAAGYGGDARNIFLWGHSAGAAHAADYIAITPAPAIAGAILTSGIYDKSGGSTESPWSIYYGGDPSRYAEMSALPALAQTALPLLVTWAEIDRADFIADGQALVRARAAAGRPVAALQVAGHSHISELDAVGTADRSLSDPVLEFIRRTSEASP